MPELPDILVYVESLRRRVEGAVLRSVQVKSPFLIRSVDPPIESIEGRRVASVGRLGKRIVLCFEGDLHLVIHLMIAGRMLWKDPGAGCRSKIDLAAFRFDSGTLVLTEASPKHRASLHVVSGAESLRAHDPGGVDPLHCSALEFARVLRGESRTLKRRLTDPRAFDGIGNAYSDEILHAARLSPFATTRGIDDEEVDRLWVASRETLERWTAALREEFGLGATGSGRFPGPGEITAFRPGFAVHGKFGRPCPVCGAKVQRIVYSENETNYCPGCQTGGRVLADRALSRLLKADWPRRMEELEDG